MRYDFRIEGYEITDEVVTRSNNTAARIGHDLIKQSGFEVWTGEGKTGTQLVEGTDYALSVKDVKRSTEAEFDIYTLFAVTNASYEGVTLYLSYTACGDYLSVENIQEMAADGIIGVINTIEPIGTIKPHPVGVPGVVPLGSEYKLCDGSVVNDVASPMNEYRVPNFTGANVSISVTWTADSGGAYATLDVKDIIAVGVHDFVTGSGIAAKSVVTSVNYATGIIVISDIAASGVIESTFFNEGRVIVGGSFGSVGDQFQGHRARMPIWAAGQGGGFGEFYQSGAGSGYRYLPLVEGDNGKPRMGDKTKGDAYSMGIYIKIKNVS